MILKNYKLLLPLFCIIFYTLEVYSLPIADGTKGSFIIRPADLFTVIVGFIGIFFIANGSLLKLDKIVALLSCYIAASLLASFRDPQIASLVGISYSFIILITYLIITSTVRDQYDFNLIVNGIIIITAIISIYIIIEQISWWIYDYKLVIPFCQYTPSKNFSCVVTDAQFLQSTYNFHGGMVRPKAFFPGVNAFGAFALPGFFLSLAKIQIKSTSTSYLICAIIFLAIILSLSRNAMLGLSIGLLFYFYAISVMKSRFIFFKRVFLLIFGTIFAIILIDISSEFFNLPRRFNVVDFFTSASTNSYELTNIGYSRFVYQESEISLFLTHFLAAIEANANTYGIGMGVQLFDSYAITLEYVKTWGSHSNFIIFLGESGIIGLTAQILIVTHLSHLFFKTINRKSVLVNHYTYILIALFSAYTGLIITGIVRTFYFNTYTFIIVALIIISYRISENFETSNKEIVS